MRKLSIWVYLAPFLPCDVLLFSPLVLRFLFLSSFLTLLTVTGRYPEHFIYANMPSSGRTKRMTYLRVPFTDEKNNFTPLIQFPSFAIELLSSQITTHLMKIKVRSVWYGFCL